MEISFLDQVCLMHCKHREKLKQINSFFINVLKALKSLQ